MKTRMGTRIICMLISVVMLVSLLPLAVWAEHEPVATAKDSTTVAYTVPKGSTFVLETCQNGFDSSFGLGKDYLFALKKDGRYYAMEELAASDAELETIGAVDVTDWISADGKSVTIPAETGKVAFFRYEDVDAAAYNTNLVLRINGGACLGYTMKTVWDAGYDNVVSETVYFTAKNADESDDSLLWETAPGGSGGAFYRYSGRYINYKNYYVDYVVDLREDGNGGYEFYWRTVNEEELPYDEWNAQHEQGFGVDSYLFCGECRHQNRIDHVAYDAPSCMDKGCAEYWYCPGCERYFKDAACTQPYEAYLTPDGYYEPILPATGHDWGANGCKNCGLAMPVYSKITNMQQFLSLGEEASYILVAQYGGKTYVLDGGDPAELAKRIDANDDSFEDIIAIDDNKDGTPDCMEIDEDGNGVWDYLENDLVNGDGVVDWHDYQSYWYDVMAGEGLADDVYSGNAYNGGIMGALAVTPNSDGTISLSGDRMLSFELTPMHSKEDIEQNLGYELEYNPEMTEEEQNAFRQEMQNNRMIKIPNLWLQPYFCWTNRKYMEERPEYGDQTIWHLYFYDDLKDKTVEIEEYDYDLHKYVMKEVPVLPEDFEETAFSLSDGALLMYSTYDMYQNLQGARENLHASLRLRDVDGTVDFVGGTSVMDLDTYEQIELTNGTQMSIFLYASDVASGHTCEFGDWEDDDNGKTHTRTCKDPECGETETKPHDWDDGVQNGEPTCTAGAKVTYTCSDCGATKTEDVESRGHDWSDWTDATEDTHTRSCQREGCGETEQESHGWSAWTPDGNTNHKKTCAGCKATRTATHNWDNGKITTQPTEEQEGVRTYTCSDCKHTRTESIPKQEHQHSWSNWEQNDADTHIRSCRCKETQTEKHNFDDGNVINWATHLAPGEVHFTCTDCGYVKIDTQPQLTDHQWSDWSDNKNGTHTRSCICNETETKDCTWDDGTVTERPTHSKEGVKTYTCTACAGIKTEPVAKLTEHEWGDWMPDNDGKNHTRSCPCGESQTLAHTFGPWEDAASTTSTITQEYRTCTVCNYQEYRDKQVKNGWIQVDGFWYYYQNNIPKTGWLQTDGVWYYFNAKGIMQTNWVLYAGYWYYFKESGAMDTGWLQQGDTWYYMDSTGAMVTGWLQQGDTWYYMDSTGAMVTGTVTIGGKQHKFDASGKWLGEVQAAKNGWVQENGKWYYYKDGAKAVGWLELSGKWYYFKVSGEMVTGWLAYGPVWYYFNSDGSMFQGFLYYGGQWYYFNDIGRMHTGWAKYEGKWYYMDANGYRVTGSHTIGGKTYNFDQSGICLNP